MSSASASTKTRPPTKAKTPDLKHIAEPLRPHALPIKQLHADPSNLRIHNERNLSAIAASLTRFGQRKAILVDAKGVTIAGAGVLAAARKLGWTHLAAVRQNDLSGAERIAFGIADNRTAELAEWDLPSLAEILGSLDPAQRDAAGFDASDLEALVKSIQEVEPPSEFPLVDETIETDHTCPKCGFKWSGGS